MQHATPGISWVEWLEESKDETDAVKLAALREYIVHTARAEVHAGSIYTDWADKKLAALGITERIGTNTYSVEAPVTAGSLVSVHVAASRAEAIQLFEAKVARGGAFTVRRVTIGDSKIIDGPEDIDPALPVDVPATVDATLAKLRETIMLAHIAGPKKICDYGANLVLDFYGLAHLPQTREFVVTRPVEATMRTVVTAYDESTALRVAGWRWEDGRKGYAVAEAASTDAFTVDVN